MYKRLALVPVCTALLSTPIQAESFDTAAGRVDVEANVTLATDYIWRGQSQTDGAGAIQGGLDITHETGLYIGAWGSNVDSDDFGGASVEFDYYVGFAGDLSENLSYDLQWVSYTFPKNNAINSEELAASLSFHGLSVGAKYTYDPEVSLYTWAGYDFELPWELGLGFHYGSTDTKAPLNGVDGDERYADWGVTLSRTLLGLDLAVMYSDTDLGSDCPYQSRGSCGSNVTLLASRSF